VMMRIIAVTPAQQTGGQAVTALQKDSVQKVGNVHNGIYCENKDPSFRRGPIDFQLNNLQKIILYLLEIRF